MNSTLALNDASVRPTKLDVQTLSLHELNDQLAREVDVLTRLIRQLVYSRAVPASEGPTAMAACIEALSILGSTTGLGAMSGLVEDLEALVATATCRADDVGPSGRLIIDEIDSCLDDIVAVARWAEPASI